MLEEKKLTVKSLDADIDLLKRQIEELTNANAKLRDMIQQLETENYWLNIAVQELLEEIQVWTEEVP